MRISKATGRPSAGGGGDRAADPGGDPGPGGPVPPGGLEHGLLDFPTRLDGRWVYLCWRMGEKELCAWHEVADGFAGRKPLTLQVAGGWGRVGIGGDAQDESDEPGA